MSAASKEVTTSVNSLSETSLVTSAVERKLVRKLDLVLMPPLSKSSFCLRHLPPQNIPSNLTIDSAGILYSYPRSSQPWKCEDRWIRSRPWAHWEPVFTALDPLLHSIRLFQYPSNHASEALQPCSHNASHNGSLGHIGDGFGSNDKLWRDIDLSCIDGSRRGRVSTMCNVLLFIVLHQEGVGSENICFWNDGIHCGGCQWHYCLQRFPVAQRTESKLIKLFRVADSNKGRAGNICF